MSEFRSIGSTDRTARLSDALFVASPRSAEPSSDASRAAAARPDRSDRADLSRLTTEPATARHSSGELDRGAEKNAACQREDTNHAAVVSALRTRLTDRFLTSSGSSRMLKISEGIACTRTTE